MALEGVSAARENVENGAEAVHVIGKDVAKKPASSGNRPENATSVAVHRTATAQSTSTDQLFLGAQVAVELVFRPRGLHDLRRLAVHAGLTGRGGQPTGILQKTDIPVADLPRVHRTRVLLAKPRRPRTTARL